MKELFTDKRFLGTILAVILFETLLKLGCYTPFLRKNSYASNIDRILSHVEEQKKNHNPDILILGTSVAYQGISPGLFQKKLEDAKIPMKVQSIAVPGAELIIQSLVLDKALEIFPNVKYILHFGEITSPWVDTKMPYLPTLSMAGEFGSIKAISRMYEFNYGCYDEIYDEKGKHIIEKSSLTKICFDDFLFLSFKSAAYRRDMRNFLLDPLYRIKQIGKKYRNKNENFYDYENSYFENMNVYNFINLEDCIKKTMPGNPIPPGSSPEHQKAILDTCALSIRTTPSSEKSPDTDSYFKRLGLVYRNAHSKNIQIINIFAPTSVLIKNLGGEKRVGLWLTELEKINGKEKSILWDFQNMFTKEENELNFYDTVHMNKTGMTHLTEAVVNRFINYLKDKN